MKETNIGPFEYEDLCIAVMYNGTDLPFNHSRAKQALSLIPQTDM